MVSMSEMVAFFNLILFLSISIFNKVCWSIICLCLTFRRLNCGGELAAAQLSAVHLKTKIGNFAYLDISPS
jgi:hypothetical protein